MTLFQKPLTEQEYISQVRHSVAKTNRYGFWMSLVGMSALLFILYQFGQVLLQFIHAETPFPVGPHPNPTAWIACGFVFGTLIGVGFGGILQANRDGVLLPFTGMRTERLMLRFHDEARGIPEFDSANDPLEGLFEETPAECEPVPAGECLNQKNELRRDLKQATARRSVSS